MLQNLNPPVYSARTEQVLPGFAQSWGSIHTQLQPLRDLFAKTLSHEDRKLQDLSLQFLVEQVLSGEISDRRLALSYESIKERLERSDDATKEMATVTAEFNSLLQDLRKQDSERVQKSFEGLYRLKALVDHSLVPLLQRFGYDASLSSQKYHAVEGVSLAAELLDLYFVVEGLDLGPEVEQLLGFLLERLSAQKAPENRKKTAVLLDRLRVLFRGPCSPPILMQLIRVVQTSPTVPLETQKFADRYVQNYSATLAERFARDRERALREQSESTLERDIAELFPGTPLLPLTHYTAETSTQLVDMGLPPLNAIKPLQILRSFCFSVLKAGYLDAVKKVVLNGIFNDKDWAKKLNDILFTAEQTLARLETFDASLETDTKIGLPALEKYLTGKAPVSSVPKALVEKLNRTAMTVLEDEAKVLTALAGRVQEILGDHKTSQPQYVSNIRIVGGKDQRFLVETLINGYNKTAQLLRILKHFIVVK